MQLDELSGRSVLDYEPARRLVQCQLDLPPTSGSKRTMESRSTRLRSPPCFKRIFATSIFNENSPHSFGSGGEKMAAAIQHGLSRHRRVARTPHGPARGLQRVVWHFLSQFLRRQCPQLVVDQRQELLGSVLVALFNGREEDAGNIGHRTNANKPRPPSRPQRETLKKRCSRLFWAGYNS